MLEGHLRIDQQIDVAFRASVASRDPAEQLERGHVADQTGRRAWVNERRNESNRRVFYPILAVPAAPSADDL
jgi:hypothetical protein